MEIQAKCRRAEWPRSAAAITWLAGDMAAREASLVSRAPAPKLEVARMDSRRLDSHMNVERSEASEELDIRAPTGTLRAP